MKNKITKKLIKVVENYKNYNNKTIKKYGSIVDNLTSFDMLDLVEEIGLDKVRMFLCEYWGLM